MKGYVVECGYMGYVDGKYILFADEQDYKEFFEENQIQRDGKVIAGNGYYFFAFH